MLFLQLFYTFFKIGLFGFGGGYAMLSMIQGEVVNRYGWISASEFTDIVAVSQMTPGPIGINSATYVGYAAIVGAGYPSWVGVIGSATATVAVVLPSFLLMLALSRILLSRKGNGALSSIFTYLRLTVVGLLAAAALLLMDGDNFGTLTGTPVQFIVSVILFLASFVAVKKFKVSPIYVIVAAGVIGGVVYNFVIV